LQKHAELFHIERRAAYRCEAPMGRLNKYHAASRVEGGDSTGFIGRFHQPKQQAKGVFEKIR
jgi:hypothetical protein